MAMIRTGTSFPFIIRVQGKNVGNPDNIRHYNAKDWTEANERFKRAIANPDNHKVEILTVLETWRRD